MARSKDKPKPSRAASKPSSVAPRPSRAITALLALSFVVPLGILLVLVASDVRFGQGYFAYRYSPVRNLRTPRALPAVAIGGAVGGAVLMLSRRERGKTLAAHAILASSAVAAGAWCWFAPPEYVNQQMFNMTSPSSDGAFAMEARTVDSLPAYLRGFPERLKESPEKMMGTRVLSNPPGATALAYTQVGGTGLEAWLMRTRDLEPDHARDVAYALRVGVLLCAVWVASGFAAYGLGRVFLSPAGAAAFAAFVTFNPCTVHFVPGKDPGQLLTVNLMLWAWFLAWKRRVPLLAALGGAILTIGATVGLIHIWVAFVAVLATAWQALRRERDARTMLVVNCAAAAAGGLAVVAAVYFVIGWNIPGTLLAVSRRWTEIQRTFDMNRTIWFAIGLPIFLLFLAPGFWTFGGLSFYSRRINFGARLAICTVAIMALIYVVMGVTYELPRLWVAFLPTLLLGLMMDRPMLTSPTGVHPRVAKAVALIVFVHVAFTAMHWTLFDVRESEYRLSSGKYYQ
jgi:hypothetical protein